MMTWHEARCLACGKHFHHVDYENSEYCAECRMATLYERFLELQEEGH